MCILLDCNNIIYCCYYILFTDVLEYVFESAPNIIIARIEEILKYIVLFLCKLLYLIWFWWCCFCFLWFCLRQCFSVELRLSWVSIIPLPQPQMCATIPRFILKWWKLLAIIDQLLKNIKPEFSKFFSLKCGNSVLLALQLKSWEEGNWDFSKC